MILERRGPSGKKSKSKNSKSRYEYVPLKHANSIRLLTLLPGDREAPVQITIAEVRSRDDPLYEALSHTWATEDGDCKRSRQIRCNGARIWVTKNCELALQYLRKENEERVLWVDAICINQQDVSERGHQVGIMHKIYSKAQKVLIWLGEASPIPAQYTSPLEDYRRISEDPSIDNEFNDHAVSARTHPASHYLGLLEVPYGTPEETNISVSYIFLRYVSQMAI